jgi:hypothetical protein
MEDNNLILKQPYMFNEVEKTLLDYWELTKLLLGVVNISHGVGPSSNGNTIGQPI